MRRWRATRSPSIALRGGVRARRPAPAYTCSPTPLLSPVPEKYPIKSPAYLPTGGHKRSPTPKTLRSGVRSKLPPRSQSRISELRVVSTETFSQLSSYNPSKSDKIELYTSLINPLCNPLLNPMFKPLFDPVCKSLYDPSICPIYNSLPDSLCYSISEILKDVTSSTNEKEVSQPLLESSDSLLELYHSLSELTNSLTECPSSFSSLSFPLSDVLSLSLLDPFFPSLSQILPEKVIDTVFKQSIITQSDSNSELHSTYSDMYFDALSKPFLGPLSRTISRMFRDSLAHPSVEQLLKPLSLKNSSSTYNQTSSSSFDSLYCSTSNSSTFNTVTESMSKVYKSRSLVRLDVDPFQFALQHISRLISPLEL